MKEDRLIRDDEESTEEVPTEIIVIADRSGSMYRIVDDAVGGFNSFLYDQKQLPGEAYLTLVRFDEEYEMVCECTPIKEMKDITRETLKPRGGTALLDAIGNTLANTMARLDTTRTKIIVVIITDGQENASEHYGIDAVRQLVEECTKSGWEFMFLGANIDAFAVGGGLGINAKSTTQYESSSRGIVTAYSHVSDTVSSFREGTSS